MTLPHMRFPTHMQNEAYVDKVESVLEDIREYLRSGVNDDLHVGEYESAAETASLLTAVLELEAFVLSETPRF